LSIDGGQPVKFDLNIGMNLPGAGGLIRLSPDGCQTAYLKDPQSKAKRETWCSRVTCQSRNEYGGSMRLLFLTAVFAGMISAQPAFDAADVRVSTRTSSNGPTFRSGRFEMLRTTLVQLIAFAYTVNQDTVVGGANWVDFDKFDVIAKAPADTKIEDGRVMLQALLTDRFKLVGRGNVIS
jgi:hypothetical protein